MDFNYFVSTQSQNLKIFLSPFLDPIGKPFIPLTQPLYDGFSYVGNLIGMDPFAILYLFCFFMNLPLAFLLRKLPAGTVRHVFCLVCGLFYSFLGIFYILLIYSFPMDEFTCSFCRTCLLLYFYGFTI